MGPIPMDNASMMEETGQQNEMFYICHSCEGRMIRSYTDHPDRYKGVKLLLRNLPYWQCTECDDAMYGGGTLMKHLIRARELYDTTGETVYVCL